MTNDGGLYCQVYKLRRGWQLWLGDAWAEVRSIRITGEHVLITMADGRVFRASYLDAVLCRPAAPAALADPLAAICQAHDHAQPGTV